MRKEFGEREKEYAIAYDPLCLNMVYVFFNSQNHIVTATIHPRSRQFVDMTYDEIQARKKTQKELGTAVKQASDTALAKVEAAGFKMAAELEKRAKQRPSITAAAKIKGIAANKKQAQHEERLQNSASLRFDDDTAGTDEYEENQTFATQHWLQ